MITIFDLNDRLRREVDETAVVNAHRRTQRRTAGGTFDLILRSVFLSFVMLLTVLVFFGLFTVNSVIALSVAPFAIGVVLASLWLFRHAAAMGPWLVLFGCLGVVLLFSPLLVSAS